MNRKAPNAECVECGRPFRKPPSLLVIRCGKCRKGMQSVRAGKQRKGVDNAEQNVQQSEAVSESEDNGVIEDGQADKSE